MQNALWIEIQAQSQNIRRVIDHLYGRELDKLQAARAFLDNGRPIVFIGMASAAYLCQPAEYYLGSHGRVASVMQASDALYALLPSLQNANVVINSRSGETIEVVKLAKALHEAKIPFLVITNEPQSTLTRLASHALWTNSRKDSLVSINIVTGMMTATLILAAEVLGLSNAIEPALKDLPELLDQTVSTAWQRADHLLALFQDVRPIYLLHRGASRGAANCGRLVLEEVSRRPAVTMEAGEFRHGPIEVVDRNFGAIIYGAAGEPGLLNNRLAQEILSYGGRVCLVERANVRIPETASLIPMPETMPIFQPILEVIPAQILAYKLAENDGRDPGSVRYISKVITSEATFIGRLNSRQRLLRAIEIRDVDHVPCSFMSFSILRNKCNQDRFAAAEAELEMGLDPMLFIPSASRWDRRDHPDLRGLPVRFHPDAKTNVWQEGDSLTGRLFKEYLTPAGKLSTSVRLSSDWPHGKAVPFLDDYQIPRADEPLIKSSKDLEALKFLLLPPQDEDIQAFHDEVLKAKAFVDEHNILLAGGWGVGMDMANWLCGMENLMVLMFDQPEFVAELLEIIHQWNKQRMDIVLSAPVDLYLRRAWYEGCDFVTPRFYRREILPRLKAEVALAHEHGAKFGYICSSGINPMTDLYLEAGIDVLVGIDPVQGTHTDMRLLKDKVGRQVCLWGGVSAAVTVEQGTDDQVRAAVREALETLGPEGFVLSPIDNITLDDPRTWQNIDVFIDEWKTRCK